MRLQTQHRAYRLAAPRPSGRGAPAHRRRRALAVPDNRLESRANKGFPAYCPIIAGVLNDCDAILVGGDGFDKAAALDALPQARKTRTRDVRRGSPDTGLFVALQRGEEERRRNAGEKRRGPTVKRCRAPAIAGGGYLLCERRGIDFPIS